jgi:hypothetical protein
MTLFEKEYLKELMSIHQEPCLSLYQPTHRRHPENQQDPIRFRNLVKQLEASLLQKYPQEKVSELLEPFEVISTDTDFWNRTYDGLVVLRSEEIFRVYGLQRRVPELAIVSDTFHTKPLQRYVQTMERFQILSLSLDSVSVLEGNRDVLDKVDLPKEVPTTMKEALGSELTEEHITVATYGGKGPKGTNMVHGHGGKKDEMDVDAERFFRTIDRAIDDYCSKPSGLPLILAALPEHHHLFQKISHNEFLIDEGIKINPNSQSTDQLRDAAWQIWQPRYHKKLHDSAQEFNQASANQLGSTELREVAKAAAAGRVNKLLLEQDKIIPGKLVHDTGAIRQDQIENPAVDDLLDDLSALVTKLGGEVSVLPPEIMPGKTGVAAIYRF